MFLFLEEAAAQQQSMVPMIVMMVALFAIMYFMMIRPEQKKKKEAEELRSNLKKGDNITTIGGIVGKIVNIKDDHITIETGEDQVRVEILKWAVMTNNTADKEKVKRQSEVKEAAKKAKEERARKKAEKDNQL